MSMPACVGGRFLGLGAPNHPCPPIEGRMLPVTPIGFRVNPGVPVTGFKPHTVGGGEGVPIMVTGPAGGSAGFCGIIPVSSS